MLRTVSALAAALSFGTVPAQAAIQDSETVEFRCPADLSNLPSEVRARCNAAKEALDASASATSSVTAMVPVAVLVAAGIVVATSSDGDRPVSR